MPLIFRSPNGNKVQSFRLGVIHAVCGRHESTNKSFEELRKTSNLRLQIKYVLVWDLGRGKVDREYEGILVAASVF